MGRGDRARTQMRAAARWLLPAAGTALGVLLSTQAAHATVQTVDVNGATTVTSDSPLSWTITADSSPISCQLNHDGAPVGSPVNCAAGTYDVPAQPPGTYTLTVYDADAGAVDPATTQQVTSTTVIDVVPPAPQPSAPANPSNDTSPTFTLGLPAAATGALCTVTPPLGAPDQTPLVSNAPCTDPYTVDLSSNLAQGDYTLTVTATADGEQSDPAQVGYTLDTLKPSPATVTVPSPGNDLTPTFTLTGVEANASVTCTATGPNGAVPVTCDTASAGLSLTKPGDPDGDYTVTVVVHDQAGNASDAASATYRLDTAGPTAPTVSPGSTTGSSRTPDFTVNEPDSGVTYACSVTGPASAGTSKCGPTTTLDLTGKPDGTYTLTVTVTDAAGNSTTGTATYTLDTTAPTAPVVTGPTTGTHNDRQPGFTVTEPDGDATVTCTVTGPDASATVNSACGSGATLDLSTAADGTYHLHVTATDPYGNAVTTTVDYTLDATAPPAPGVTPPASPTPDTTPTVAISDGDPTALLSCVLTGPGGSVFSGPCPADGVFDTGSHGDGTYSLAVTATDPAGNTSTTTVSWVQDTNPPPPPDVSTPPALTRNPVVTLTLSDTEAGVGLTCVLTGPGGTVFSGPCPGDGTFDTTGDLDGTYTLDVTATDAAGNTSTTTSVSWVVDTTPPPPPSVTPPASPTRQTQPTVTITDGQPTATLTCELTDPDGNVIASGACPGDGVFDTTTGSRDGVYTLVVTATDAAGNSSTTTVSWTRDTLPPPVPVVIPPGSPTRDTSPTVAISDGDPTAVLTCVLTGPGGASVFSGTCPANGVFDTTSYGDGTYSLLVTAKDPAGNTSTKTVTWLRDTLPPPPPDVSAPAPLTNSKTVTLSISDTESGVTLTCLLTGPAGEVVYSGACPASGTFDTNGHIDGIFTLVVTAADAAGNTSTTTVSWTRDTTAPPAPKVTGPSSPTKVTAPTVAISDTEADVTLTCVLTGPGGTVSSGVCPANGVFDTSSYGDGTYSLVVTATDPAGNSTATTVTWVRDTLPPPNPDVSAPAPLTNSKTVTLSISDTESGVTLTCLLTGPAGELVSSGACPANGTFSTNGHIDGTYTLVVTATDAAGNSSSTTVHWDRDTQPPPTPTVSAPPSLTKQFQVTLTISDTEADATLTCVLTGPDGTVLSGPCPAGGVFDTTGHVDGTYTLVVTATDPAGNATSTTVSWMRDTTPPPPPAVTPPVSPTNVTQPTVTISDSEHGVTLTCVLTAPNGATAFSGACPGNGRFDTSGFGDGTYTLVVTATDAAGNSSTQSVTWDRDTVPPPDPDVSSPPSLTRFRTVTLSIGDTESGVAITCVLTDPKGRTIFSGTCPADGVFDTGTSVDGTYTLTVTATDAAGNSASTAVTWMQDTTPPPAPNVSTPPSLTNSRSVTLTIDDTEADAVVTCELTGPNGGTVLSGACPAGGVFDTTGHADGVYTLVVTATDPAGNITTTTVSWTRDTTPPVTPVVQAPGSPAQGRSPQFTVTEPESPVTWSCTATGPSTVTFSACGLTSTLNLTGAADGVYTVSVVAIDPAGNPSLAGTATYELDTTPPPAPVVSAPPALTKSFTTTVSIGDLQTDAVLTCVLTSPGGRTVYSGLCPADGSFDTTGFSDGIYTLVVTATDSAANASTTTVSWRRDTTPPPVPVVAAPPSPSNDRAPSFTVTEPESPVTFTCTVTGPSTVTVTACGRTVTLDLSNASDGTYTVSVTATDPAGNESAAGSVTWVLDTIAPPAPTVTAPTSPGNSRHPSFTVADTETGVQWTCQVSGPGSATVASCGPTTVLNLTGSPDGTYTVTVSAVDAAGNVSDVTTASYTLDTTPPPAPSVTAPRSPSHDTTPTYAISDTENGVVITCVLVSPDGRTVFSGVCPADGTFDTTSFTDGVYTLTVTATDAATNSSSTTVAWTRDTLPPPPPAVSAPLSPAQSRSPSFSVSDAESGLTYTCTVTGPGAATVTACGATTTVDLTGAADGTYTLTVTATDAADNTSTASSATYTLDTTAPSTPGVSASPSPAQGRHPTFSLSGVEQGGVLTCTVSGPVSVALTGPCGASMGLDLTGQPDGSYTVSVTVTDAAGNVSPAGSATYILDTTPPVQPSAAGHTSPSNDRKPSFGVVTESGATLTCTVARYFVTVWSGPCGPGGSVDLTAYQDGEFEITIVATDAAGNVGPPTTIDYVLDTTPPTAATLTPPASPSPVEKPVWIFTIEDGTTATCTVTGANGQIVQGPVGCTSPFTGQFKSLPDGTYLLTVVVTDDAGNDSTPTTSVFILDRHAPVPPTVVPPSSPDNTHHPAWTITAPRGATLTCTLSSAGSIISGPSACPADGVFSLAGLPDGTYTLRVTATDSAGNVSATSVTTYVLDTVRPAAPKLDYASSAASSDTHPYWGFTLPDGTVGRCELLRDGVVLMTKTGCKGAVSFDLTGRPAGTYTLRVYAIDAAGNVSLPMIAGYVLGIRQQVPPPVGSPTGSSGGSGPFTGADGGGHHGGGPALGARQVQQVLEQFTNATAPVRSVVKRAAHAVNHVASSILPVIHDKVTEHVAKAVQGVVNAVSHAGGGTGFPLLLLFVVLAFLLMQNRIDRRDPKLALASVAADDTVEFLPPPSRRSPTRRDKGGDG